MFRQNRSLRMVQVLLLTALPAQVLGATPTLGQEDMGVPSNVRGGSGARQSLRHLQQQQQQMNTNTNTNSNTVSNPDNVVPADDTLDDAFTWTDDDMNNKSTWSDLDQFTYKNDRTYWPNNVYPPDQWIDVGCLDLDNCLGWPDTFDASQGWEFHANHCMWCPAEGNNTCGKHHNSPINLYRNVAVVGDPLANACIDVHWMQYIDSSCTFEMLQQFNSFSIERYGLKIKQPMEQLSDGTYVNACQVPGVGGRWGKIDFSRGFTQWWLLSNIDIHVPSEHTQNGHRYSAELQMYHFYSIDTVGTEYQTNQLAAVSVFLQAYDNEPDYDVLNRLICQWRKVEDETRAQCGLPSVLLPYHGCTFPQRGHNVSGWDDDTVYNNGANTTFRTRRYEEESSSPNEERRRTTKSMHDLFVEDYVAENTGNPGHRRRIQIDPNEMNNLPLSEDEWKAFLQSVQQEQEELLQSTAGDEELHDEEDEASSSNQHDPEGTDNNHRNRNRKLLDYEYVTWNNYFAMLACKTEYYYRYSGSMTIPPCFGRLRLGQDNRVNTNNWRVMKDPIRVSQRQIDELHRLIRMRIAPIDDPLHACKYDTAATSSVDPNDDYTKISVARPLQSNQETHWMVFCECENWISKWPQDQEWCLLNKTTRFHQQPYNFESDGY